MVICSILYKYLLEKIASGPVLLLLVSYFWILYSVIEIYNKYSCFNYHVFNDKVKKWWNMNKAEIWVLQLKFPSTLCIIFNKILCLIVVTVEVTFRTLFIIIKLAPWGSFMEFFYQIIIEKKAAYSILRFRFYDIAKWDENLF